MRKALEYAASVAIVLALILVGLAAVCVIGYLLISAYSLVDAVLGLESGTTSDVIAIASCIAFLVFVAVVFALILIDLIRYVHDSLFEGSL